MFGGGIGTNFPVWAKEKRSEKEIWRRLKFLAKKKGQRRNRTSNVRRALSEMLDLSSCEFSSFR